MDPLDGVDTDIPEEETPEEDIPVVDLDAPAREFTGFFEVEKVILTRASVPTIERLKAQFSEAGGSLRGVRFAQKALEERPGWHELRATISLTLKDAAPASEIAIRMHNFGETNYVLIKDIKISDGKETVSLPNFVPTSIGRDVSSSTNPAENRYGIERKWIFPLRNVKKITVELSQTNPYPMRYTMAMFSATHRTLMALAPVGGQPFIQIGWLTDVSCREVFQELARRYKGEIRDSKELSARLVAFIPELLSIGPFSPKMELLPEFVGASKPADLFSLDESIGEEGLVTIPREESNRWRYAIGISEIAIGTRKYSVSSEFVSRGYPLTSVSSVSIDTDVFVPGIFPSGEWLRFFISFDDGLSWHRICPVNLSAPETIPKVIHVNADTPEVVKDKNPAGRAAYIDTDEHIKSVRLKIELYRPEGAEFTSLSPVVHSYRVRIVR